MSVVEVQWIMEKLDKWVRIRVDGIMQGNHRKYYAECASFIAALGEVRESQGEINGKAKLIEEYRSAYSRRTAFHQELRAYGKFCNKLIDPPRDNHIHRASFLCTRNMLSVSC